MRDCFWNDDGPPWKCQWCDWKAPFDTVEPPHRNCPKAPNREQAERERLDRELKDLVDSGVATRTMNQIQATLKSCRGGCPHYVGHVCIRRGRSCTHRKRWIESLIFTGCTDN
ncbi:unnamed protein product [marine sediment metagenome]|uniref:Uncharacterized protein n=1 Tax=marine sediment metagenome TaxID=412755 RepID=X0TIT6_9ZZZZ